MTSRKAAPVSSTTSPLRLEPQGRFGVSQRRKHTRATSRVSGAKGEPEPGDKCTSRVQCSNVAVVSQAQPMNLSSTHTKVMLASSSPSASALMESMQSYESQSQTIRKQYRKHQQPEEQPTSSSQQQFGWSAENVMMGPQAEHRNSSYSVNCCTDLVAVRHQQQQQVLLQQFSSLHGLSAVASALQHQRQQQVAPGSGSGSGSSSAPAPNMPATPTIRHAHHHNQEVGQNSSAISTSGRRTRDSRKCRKVYGMEQRQLWCTQCKWKKACSRFCDLNNTSNHFKLPNSSMDSNPSNSRAAAAAAAGLPHHSQQYQRLHLLAENGVALGSGSGGSSSSSSMRGGQETGGEANCQLAGSWSLPISQSASGATNSSQLAAIYSLAISAAAAAAAAANRSRSRRTT